MDEDFPKIQGALGFGAQYSSSAGKYIIVAPTMETLEAVMRSDGVQFDAEKAGACVLFSRTEKSPEFIDPNYPHASATYIHPRPYNYPHNSPDLDSREALKQRLENAQRQITKLLEEVIAMRSENSEINRQSEIPRNV